MYFGLVAWWLMPSDKVTIWITILWQLSYAVSLCVDPRQPSFRFSVFQKDQRRELRFNYCFKLLEIDCDWSVQRTLLKVIDYRGAIHCVYECGYCVAEITLTLYVAYRLCGNVTCGKYIYIRGAPLYIQRGRNCFEKKKKEIWGEKTVHPNLVLWSYAHFQRCGWEKSSLNFLPNLNI